MKRVFILCLTLLMLMTASFPTLGATTIPNDLTQSQRIELLNALEAKGLLDDNPKLVEKIKNGELPDSLKPL